MEIRTFCTYCQMSDNMPKTHCAQTLGSDSVREVKAIVILRRGTLVGTVPLDQTESQGKKGRCMAKKVKRHSKKRGTASTESRHLSNTRRNTRRQRRKKNEAGSLAETDSREKKTEGLLRFSRQGNTRHGRDKERIRRGTACIRRRRARKKKVCWNDSGEENCKTLVLVTVRDKKVGIWRGPTEIC
jgi:hypothetical protein